MATEIQRADMNREEAVATCNTIRQGLEDIRALVLDLHDRRGWAALGYESWRDCVTSEFNKSESYLYRQLQAALIEREISPIGETGQIPESQLRPLAAVPKEKRTETWEEAKATAPNGKITAKHVREVADRKIGRPKPEPKPETPRSQYKAQVNGQVAADPSDIAAKRSAGKIGADVVVEVIEPDPIEEAEPAPEPVPIESEDEWLAKLPLSSVLVGIPLAIFQSDARRYYRMKKARDTARHHHDASGKGLRKDGCYFKRVSDFLKTADPRDWIKCATSENGGCDGTGLLSVHGGQACPKCFGRGYTIDNRRDWRKLA